MTESNKEKDQWFKHTRGEFWGAPTANTKLYKFFAMFPITGFLGLDHLYLRSAWTFALKLIVNIFTFGFWYFYDVAQALSFKTDRIDKYGLALPLIGPKGLGAGIFKGTEGAVEGNPEEAASSLWFLAYGLLSMLPFGAEYFLVDDIAGGILKFITSIPLLIGSIFSAKVAIILGSITLIMSAINVGILMINPETILCKGTPEYWPVTSFMDCKYRPMERLVQKAPGAVNECEKTEDCGDPAAGMGKFIFKNFTPMGRAASMIEKRAKDAISKNPMATKFLDKAQGVAGQVSKIQSAVEDKVAQVQGAVAQAQGAVAATTVAATTAAATGLIPQGAIQGAITNPVAAISSQATQSIQDKSKSIIGSTQSGMLDKTSGLLRRIKRGGYIEETESFVSNGGAAISQIENPSTTLMFVLSLLLIGGTFMAGRRAVNRIGKSIAERPPEPFINLDEEENVSDTPPKPNEFF